MFLKINIYNVFKGGGGPMKILNHIQHGDTFLLKTINISLKCKCLDIIMPLVTRLASKFSLVTFCLFTELNPNPFIHMIGLKCTISLIISTIISQVFKQSVSRIRPFLIVNNLNIQKIGIDEYSFPSGTYNRSF